MANFKPVYSDVVKTPMFVAAFPWLIEKRKKWQSEELEYSVKMLFPKATTDLTDLRNVIAQTAKKAFGDNVDPARLQLPIKDGDAPSGDDGTVKEYTAGHWVMKASAKTKTPFIYDSDGKTRITEQCKLSNGNLMRAHVCFMAYDKGTRGVKALLDSGFKAGEGKPLNIGVSEASMSGRYDEDVKAPVANNYGF